jgi:hypothetical protein
MRLEAFKSLERVSDEQLKDEFAVQNEIIADKIYLQYRLEKEVYNQAIVHFKLAEEPEVKRIIAEVDNQIP